MTALRGRARSASLAGPLSRAVWPIGGETTPLDARAGCATIVCGERLLEGFGLYLVLPGLDRDPDMRPSVELPLSLGYLQPGDVVSVSPDGLDVAVLWRHTSTQNFILLTEQCDNYCLMCSQPPKDHDDRWLLRRAMELVEVLPQDAPSLILTGGEPTLYGDGLLQLLARVTAVLPRTEVHLLSNGRRFADEKFALEYARVGNPRLMVGIPIYGTTAALHDFIVQAAGAFRETVRGVLNLARLEQRVEIRVVLQKYTAPVIVDIAEYIARNLPFVEQVALMGLELTGLARPNFDEVWVDPYDYRAELSEAANLLASSGIRTLIFNHQLCTLEERAWRFAVKSISDWKNDFVAECSSCDVLDRCGGFFRSSELRRSSYIKPIRLTSPSPAP